MGCQVRMSGSCTLKLTMPIREPSSAPSSHMCLPPHHGLRVTCRALLAEHPGSTSNPLQVRHPRRLPAAAGAPKYAGAEDTRGALRVGGNGGEATATVTAQGAEWKQGTAAFDWLGVLCIACWHNNLPNKPCVA